jgi:hypothetical protein
VYRIPALDSGKAEPRLPSSNPINFPFRLSNQRFTVLSFPLSIEPAKVSLLKDSGIYLTDLFAGLADAEIEAHICDTTVRSYSCN